MIIEPELTPAQERYLQLSKDLATIIAERKRLDEAGAAAPYRLKGGAA